MHETTLLIPSPLDDIKRGYSDVENNMYCHSINVNNFHSVTKTIALDWKSWETSNLEITTEYRINFKQSIYSKFGHIAAITNTFNVKYVYSYIFALGHNRLGKAVNMSLNCVMSSVIVSMHFLYLLNK